MFTGLDRNFLRLKVFKLFVLCLYNFDLFSFSFCLIYIDSITEADEIKYFNKESSKQMVSFIDGWEDYIDITETGNVEIILL